MEIGISMTLLSIINIDTVNFKFTTDYFISVEWFDDRLRYKDLNGDRELNAVTREDLDFMWTPQIAFYNSLDCSTCYQMVPNVAPFCTCAFFWTCR